MASQSVSKPHPLNLGLLCEMKGITLGHDKKTFFFVNDLTIRIRWRKSLQQNLQLNSERALKCEEIQDIGMVDLTFFSGKNFNGQIYESFILILLLVACSNHWVNFDVYTWTRIISHLKISFFSGFRARSREVTFYLWNFSSQTRLNPVKLNLYENYFYILYNIL